MTQMLLGELVATSTAVAATRSRKAKVAAIAELLARTDRAELGLVTSYLAGAARQRRTGVGWRSLSDLPEPSSDSTLTVVEVDAAMDELARQAGPGSAGRRATLLATLLGRATAEEQQWLRGLIVGELRQGALEAVVQEAIAAAAEVPLTAVRRAAMLAGSSVAVVESAFAGGAEALAEVGLEVGRPITPMLASSATSVPEAIAKLTQGADDVRVAVDTKLDGIRIQVHRDGDEVLIATRSLDDITDRLPEVVEVVRDLPAKRLVLDGEALAIRPDGRPSPFQETASRTAQSAGVRVTPYFFDLLHVDGEDLLDQPYSARRERLDALVPSEHRTAGLVTAAADEAETFTAGVLEDGHEGVIVKSLGAAYQAGRRGASWIKVKPVHTLDLVVLAVEWGSGRRSGKLSNIHLGARDPDSPDDDPSFVMLGKTFKGMTDEILAWQTERFTDLALDPSTVHDDYVVRVRPEQVVEIAFDGVQRSTRYPGGVALRFARVLRYRDDKTPAQADPIETVRAMLT